MHLYKVRPRLSSLQLGVAQLDKGGEGCAGCERPELYCGDGFLIGPGVKELPPTITL